MTEIERAREAEKVARRLSRLHPEARTVYMRMADRAAARVEKLEQGREEDRCN